MLALLEPSCTPTASSRGSSSIFCASEGTRTAWLAAAIAGMTVGLIGTVGLATVPRKIEVVPTATANGGGLMVVGHF
jgi:hypothetical protein